MKLSRLSNGERVAGVSAILLLVLMFFHWFGVNVSNHSKMLFYIRSVLPGRNAWEALDYIPIVLLITIIVTLAAVTLRLTSAVRKPSVRVNTVVVILGVISVVLILFRIVDPPNFGMDGSIAYEGTVQFPIFLALLAAAGIVAGGYRGMREGATMEFNRKGG